MNDNGKRLSNQILWIVFAWPISLKIEHWFYQRFQLIFPTWKIYKNFKLAKIESDETKILITLCYIASAIDENKNWEKKRWNSQILRRISKIKYFSIIRPWLCLSRLRDYFLKWNQIQNQNDDAAIAKVQLFFFFFSFLSFLKICLNAPPPYCQCFTAFFFYQEASKLLYNWFSINFVTSNLLTRLKKKNIKHWTVQINTMIDIW